MPKRATRTSFKGGESGNPRGRPTGTRNAMSTAAVRGLASGVLADKREEIPPRTSEIPRWAKSYSYGEDRIVDELSPRARARGHLTRSEFLELCRWKTPRSQPRCASNTAAQVREATQVALATDDERAKMYILRSLAGVGWPTASVILHFCDKRPYPILDYRALWSVGFAKPPAYTFEFWWAYTDFARRLSRSTGHDMRTLDRALWQFSKARQKRWR